MFALAEIKVMLASLVAEFVISPEDPKAAAVEPFFLGALFAKKPIRLRLLKRQKGAPRQAQA